MNLLQRLKNTSDEIDKACLRSDRAPGSVHLMLVTKTVPMERILPAYDLGHRLFGENKIQEVIQKWTEPKINGLKPDFIGHLQTNKIKHCLECCARIHSVDRLGLAESLERELQRRGEQREVFIQVNTSGEISKYGVAPAEALKLAQEISRFSTLKVTGLMTLALFSKDETLVRPCFKRLKELHSQIQEQDLFGKDFKHLSMGMSSDYIMAVEEGATIVRVGTAIFGARSTPDAYYWPEKEKGP